MWIWVLLAAVVCFVIAAVTIGGVTGNLAARPRRSVYDIDEAVDFVADRLPDELTAELSYDDVRAVLLAHCDYLESKGVASEKAADDIGAGLVVVPDDEPVAWVLGRLEELGVEIADADVVTVLDAEERYYEAIGAIGPRVTGPDELDVAADDASRPDPEV
ncbi:MAG: hypothetical protein JST64_07550 [Actinobacteria bacterium]|nr:hypothetical protein [Actinomycetota bacterium]